MNNDQKLDLLKQEYFKLQDFYEDFDKRTHTIKGWSITASLAGIATGFINKNEYIGLLSALTALIFWVMEVIWKSFQYHYRLRIIEIETRISTNDIESFVPLQMYSSWFQSYKANKIPFHKIMLLTSVFMPHLMVVMLGLLFFILHHFSVVKFW